MFNICTYLCVSLPLTLLYILLWSTFPAHFGVKNTSPINFYITSLLANFFMHFLASLFAPPVSFMPIAAIALSALRVLFFWNVRERKAADVTRKAARLFAQYVIFILFGIFLVMEYHPKTPPCVSLASPFSHTGFVVASGGQSRPFNHHIPEPQQRWALDIIRPLGYRELKASLSGDIASFSIFGEQVTSPCSGSIFSAEDNRIDQKLGQRDEVHLKGNHVVIECAGAFRVRLVHLQRGSITVKAGQKIAIGDHVGKVGNSGWSSQPHLHIDAQKRIDDEWVGVPILLEGRLLHRFDGL